MTASGAPPTVDTKQLFVHSVGNRDFRVRNSCRKLCEETPLRCLTNRWIPNCGSISTSTCTWSGMISKAMISARYFLPLIYCKHLFAPFSAGSDPHSSPILRRPHEMLLALIDHVVV